jgi:hypothetical protein
MTPTKGLAPFLFDFSRADWVLWSYGSQSGEQEVAVGGGRAGFFVDDADIADQFSHTLAPLMADLVDVAIAAHVADRLALRKVQPAGSWSRHIEARVCVREPDFWGSAVLKERLENLLAFLTEDVWSLAFVVRRDSRRRSEIQTHLGLTKVHGEVEVNLFSGGLDSFAGNAAEAAERDRHFILVSGCPNTHQRFRQQQQVKLLRGELRRQMSHVCVRYWIQRGDEYPQESSRRTRGFLFLILGGVTALSAGCSSLGLHENGLGAINLPYDESQVGTDNARAVHPRTLREVGELLGLVANNPFSILNGSIFKTKAEMLRHPGFRKVSNGVPLTFSCDGFPVRTKGHPQCGFCTSCLLRRYSLETAGLAEADSGPYLQDWRSGSFNPNRHHLRGLRAMHWQVLRLSKCFAQHDPWHALCFDFPELRAVVHDLSPADPEARIHAEASLMGMLKQHTTDWPHFSALQLLSAAERRAA